MVRSTGQDAAREWRKHRFSRDGRQRARRWFARKPVGAPILRLNAIDSIDDESPIYLRRTRDRTRWPRLKPNRVVSVSSGAVLVQRGCGSRSPSSYNARHFDFRQSLRSTGTRRGMLHWHGIGAGHAARFHGVTAAKRVRTGATRAAERRRLRELRAAHSRPSHAVEVPLPFAPAGRTRQSCNRSIRAILPVRSGRWRPVCQFDDPVTPPEGFWWLWWRCFLPIPGRPPKREHVTRLSLFHRSPGPGVEQSLQIHQNPR